MAYEKTSWIDGVTKVSAENMNKIEKGIEDAHSGIETFDEHLADYATQEEFDGLEQDFNQHKLDYVEHLNSNMPHRFENKVQNKTYKFGFQISAEGNPQIIYEEVI